MYSLIKSISSKKINFKSNSDLFFNSKFKIAIILFSIFIGALNSDLTAQESKNPKLEDGQVIVFCQPDIDKCIENLENLKLWLWNDYNDRKLSNKIHDEYHLVVINTIASLEMFLDDRDQCNMSSKLAPLEYWSPKIPLE
tara:strand:- start:178 stop:597 length:420 start_codon:yes stop_codon:yes gene_type:complete